MTVQCIACSNFSMRKAGKELARLGFGNCTYDPDWRYHSAEWIHSCIRFVAVSQEEVDQRRAWLKSQEVTHNAEVSGAGTASAAMRG